MGICYTKNSNNEYLFFFDTQTLLKKSGSRWYECSRDDIRNFNSVVPLIDQDDDEEYDDDNEDELISNLLRERGPEEQTTAYGED